MARRFNRRGRSFRGRKKKNKKKFYTSKPRKLRSGRIGYRL